MADTDRAIITKGQLKTLGEMIRSSGGDVISMADWNNLFNTTVENVNGVGL